MTKVVWRPWRTAEDEKKITDAMGADALESHESEVDARFVKPHEIIEQLAVVEYGNSPDYFDRTQKITVLEPASCAGAWDVHVDYNPEFTARKATNGN